MSNDPPLVAPNPTTDMFAPQIPSDFAGTPAYPSAASIFANDVQQAGQFTPGGIRTAVATGQQRLTTSPDGKPCATCDKAGAYSIAFDVKDANGKMCGEGMYYTVWYASQGAFQGTTDANGMTERYFSQIEGEKIYLYLGHRERADRYPTDRSLPEDAHDEAPLADDTFAPIAEKKIKNTQTQRLWKPWKISQGAEDFTIMKEGILLNPYDNDGATPGNVTVGIGLLVHHGEFVMDQSRLDQVTSYMNRNNIPVNVPNIVNSVGPATGLQGADLRKAQQEMNYVNGLSETDARNTFKQKTYPDHRVRIEEKVFVPLYQREYDALCDVAYNRGPDSIWQSRPATANRRGYNVGGSYSDWLNRGRYYYTGNNRVRNLARPASVAGRRDEEADMFLNGVYPGGAPRIRANNGRNEPPWSPVQITP